MKQTENIVYGVLISIIVILILMKLMKKDKYSGDLRPEPIQISQVNPKGPKSIFDLPYKLDCVPGPTPEGSNYTKSLTPGGFCGAGQWVASQANYTITGGIGDNKLGD
jgi:hypothetical protein